MGLRQDSGAAGEAPRCASCPGQQKAKLENHVRCPDGRTWQGSRQDSEQENQRKRLGQRSGAQPLVCAKVPPTGSVRNLHNHQKTYAPRLISVFMARSLLYLLNYCWYKKGLLCGGENSIYLKELGNF